MYSGVRVDDRFLANFQTETADYRVAETVCRRCEDLHGREIKKLHVYCRRTWRPIPTVIGYLGHLNNFERVRGREGADRSREGGKGGGWGGAPVQRTGRNIKRETRTKSFRGIREKLSRVPGKPSGGGACVSARG